VVSLFEAKLPLLSPFAVSLKVQLRIEHKRAEPTGFFLFPRAELHLLFDVQVCTTKTPAVSGQIAQALLALCE